MHFLKQLHLELWTTISTLHKNKTEGQEQKVTTNTCYQGAPGGDPDTYPAQE